MRWIKLLKILCDSANFTVIEVDTGKLEMRCAVDTTATTTLAFRRSLKWCTTARRREERSNWTAYPSYNLRNDWTLSFKSPFTFPILSVASRCQYVAYQRDAACTPLTMREIGFVFVPIVHGIGARQLVLTEISIVSSYNLWFDVHQRANCEKSFRNNLYSIQDRIKNKCFPRICVRSSWRHLPAWILSSHVSAFLAHTYHLPRIAFCLHPVVNTEQRDKIYSSLGAMCYDTNI